MFNEEACQKPLKADYFSEYHLHLVYTVMQVLGFFSNKAVHTVLKYEFSEQTNTC